MDEGVVVDEVVPSSLLGGISVVVESIFSSTNARTLGKGLTSIFFATAFTVVVAASGVVLAIEVVVVAELVLFVFDELVF